MDIQDFSHVKHFPGTTGNPFDLVLHRLNDLQKIPWIVFALGLFLLAWIPSYLDPKRAVGLFLFFLLDWAMLAALPRARVSFGPPRPSVLYLAILRIPFALLPLPYALAFQIVGTVLVIYAFWIEPLRLTLTHQKLVSSKLHGSLRVLHLGDLHLERITRRELKLNQLIKQLHPDLILFSGDILNLSYLEDPTAIKQAREIISEWKAPLGTFFVSGSEAVDLHHVFPDLVSDPVITWLDNKTATVQTGTDRLNIIGVTCTHKPFLDAPVVEKLAEPHQDQFNILLYHSPDLAPNAARMGIDLQLSGHTHGGQVRLPVFGALFTASLYGRKFSSGRYQIKNLTLYITRGIGMEGQAAPRVRFLCPPEIILWEIGPADVK